VRIPLSRANVLTAALLAVLLGLIVVTAPRWTRLLSRPVPGEEAAGEEAPPAEAREETAAPVERQINVKLLFPSAAQPGLVMEERTVAFSDDLAHQLRAVVEEIVKGPAPGASPPPAGGLQPSLPPETKVLNLFVSPSGVAYVDLSKEALVAGRGSFEELLSVYSIVNSLTVNFPAVRRVQILIDDRPAQTLGGHVDLTHPLRADMTLLAASSLTPATPSPGASPAAAPAGPSS
jgi:spore germination protein GerM